MPLSAIGSMTEYEFGLWQRRGKPLWPRRMELMLAQLTSMLAQVNGNNHTLRDVDLFDPRAEQRTQLDEAAESIADLSGSGIRKLGQGRKRG